MTREDAARVLRGMDLRTIRSTGLYGFLWYVNAVPGRLTELDGEFTADELRPSPPGCATQPVPTSRRRTMNIFLISPNVTESCRERAILDKQEGN